MRKKLLYFLLVLILLLSIFYIIRYKSGVKYKNKVPANAEAILHLNLRQLENKVLIDALKNPLSYIDFSSSSKKDDNKKKDFLDAITVPKNLFLYVVNGVVLSDKIIIKDKSDFDVFLNQEQFEKEQFENINIYKKRQLHLVTNDDYLIFAYNNSSENINVLLKDVFLNTNFLDQDDVLLKQIKSSGSDGAFVSNKNDFLVLNVKGGELNVEGSLKSFSKFFLPKNTVAYSDSLVAYTSGKVNVNELKTTLTVKQEEKFNKLTSMSLDSIFNKWNGDFNFNINAIESKIDTIITYEYDDDFNRVEKKSTQKVINPNLDFKLTGKELYSYFVNEKAIKLVEEDSLFTVVPIGKLYANHNENDFLVSSGKTLEFSKKNKTNKFQLFLNIEKYLANQIDLYTIKQSKETDLLKNISLVITEKDSLKASVKLKNKSRNFIGQFISNQ